MGVSLSFRAVRDSPLTDSETSRIKELIDAHPPPESDVDGLWEHFWVYEFNVENPEPIVPNTILSGSTKLPPWEEMEIAITHWAGLLGEIRLLLPDAGWDVHVEGDRMRWNAMNSIYEFPPTEPKPRLEVPFPPTHEIQKEHILPLISRALNLPDESAPAEVEAEVLRRIGPDAQIVFVPAAPLSEEQLQSLRGLWLLITICPPEGLSKFPLLRGF